MNSSTTDDPLNWTAALLMTLNGVFGIVTNAIIVHNFFSLSSERTSFNLICTFRAVTNCIILTLGFLATFVPLTLYGDTLFPPVHHAIVITIINSLYTGLQNCGFLIALNRFCAIFFMIFYSKWFTVKVTFALVSLMFAYRIFRMGQDIIQNIETQCFSTYSSDYLTWFPTMDKRCANKYANVFDLSTLLLIGLLLINIATFIRIYIFYRKTDLDSKELKQRMRKNSILFAQTILQDLAYLIDMLLTFKLSGLINARYWTFISGTFYWECVHSFDGLIMIMFNEKLTFMRRTLFSSEPSSSSVGPQQNAPPMMSPARNSPAPVG